MLFEIKEEYLKNGRKWLFDKSVDKMISVINFREISIVRILLQIEVTVFRLIVEQLLALYTRIQMVRNNFLGLRTLKDDSNEPHH